MTFSNRLKKILESKGMSQAEAARQCNIAQQSMNYILNSNLKSSKLAPTIADALNINIDWLLTGEGRPETINTIEIPIIHSPYMLKKFLNGALTLDTLEYTIVDKFLGTHAFAYLITSKEMIICSEKPIDNSDFLIILDDEVIISDENTENTSFFIFEKRVRTYDF